MQDWLIVIMVLGTEMIIASGLLWYGLRWVSRDSQRSLQEFTYLSNENTRRSIERMDRAHRRNNRLMDAHIAMVLERVDRDK